MESKNETNYLRLLRLITLANKILVIILRRRFPPNVLKYDGEIQKVERRLKALVKDPKLLHILFPPGDHYRGNFSELDISYLYQLLRFIGNIPEHNKRWGNIPEDTDRSMAANIERIRMIRNEHFHKSDVSLTNEEFRDHCNILSQCILELGGMTYKPKIDEIPILPNNAEYGADTNSPSRDGSTALDLPNSENATEVVKLLLDN
ncbi:unnamed protein product [Mytilus coruscus]|uniref:DZIP3-like HEPN domain-containing protein n=1 Tax=Mytilus coruscus TaxID=42192 RepID=A0A6J8EZP8_MYTCO|nr:unnamed protein product [Mytilus coruscus]